MIVVTGEAFDPAAALARFTAAQSGAGAIVSFIGTVRDRSNGNPVEELVLEHYPGFTEKEIARAEEEARRRWAPDDILIIHRYGALAPGQPIVFVAASSTHRHAAFAAVQFLMDYLRTDAPFWKRESGPAGATWVEPRDDDAAARARWNHGSTTAAVAPCPEVADNPVREPTSRRTPR